jgi:hypothetical protein
MKRVVLALLVVAMLAGCSARANKDDFFGYMKKPLYASSFSLDRLHGSQDTESFFVEDGSIGTITVRVWVNATAGAASVRVYDPTGAEVLNTTQTTTRAYPLNLGGWKVVVTASEDAAGKVDLLVVRGKTQST